MTAKNPYITGKASTHERGYGATHQAERRRWAPRVEAGGVCCCECGKPIAPGTSWDLAHDHASVTVRYLGPAHKSCNIREANRRRARTRPRRWALLW